MRLFLSIAIICFATRIWNTTMRLCIDSHALLSAWKRRCSITRNQTIAFTVILIFALFDRVMLRDIHGYWCEMRDAAHNKHITCFDGFFLLKVKINIDSSLCFRTFGWFEVDGRESGETYNMIGRGTSWPTAMRDHIDAARQWQTESIRNPYASKHKLYFIFSCSLFCCCCCPQRF